MADERVEYRPDRGIPYRAEPVGTNAEGEREWQMEYMQNPRDGYWGPRGVFTEKDGHFHWAGIAFDSPRAVLVYRANNPI
jgi:hypothetical protein